jgi:hypothetical protein
MIESAKGCGSSTTSNSHRFMAVFILKMHQIFMLAFAGLRVEGKVAQVLVVSEPRPWSSSCLIRLTLGSQFLSIDIRLSILYFFHPEQEPSYEEGLV